MSGTRDASILDASRVDVIDAGHDLDAAMGPDAAVGNDSSPGPDTGDTFAARCTDGVMFPSVGWEARHFVLMQDGSFGACLGVDDIATDRIDRDYGVDGPAPGVPDRFATRYTATRTLTVGVHTFVLTHDDGLRVFIDGQLIYERWVTGAATDIIVRTPYLTAGNHDIIVEHFDETGSAGVNVAFNAGCDPLVGGPGDWTVAYLRLAANDEIDRSHCYGVETIAGEGLDLDWASSAPQLLVDRGVLDHFVVVAKSRRGFRGVTRFTTSYDDGLRIKVGGRTRLDAWSTGTAIEQRFTIYEAGDRDVEIEMFERLGAARLEVSWEQECSQRTSVNATEWYARYYRVGVDNTVQPARYFLDRDDCLGTERIRTLQLNPAFVGEAATPVGLLGVTDRWGGEYFGPRTFMAPTTIDVTHDDGLRVYAGEMGDILVYDAFTAPQVTMATISVGMGNNLLRLLYFENQGGAQLRLTW